MAWFPDEPRRFVGRTAAMAGASRALAPNSGRTAVLFHGMAGTGRTACALELAYRHQDVFAAAVFWQAPPHGEDFAGALSLFALAMERQLRGFQMVHATATEAQRVGFLPSLRRMLAQRDCCSSSTTWRRCSPRTARGGIRAHRARPSS